MPRSITTAPNAVRYTDTEKFFIQKKFKDIYNHYTPGWRGRIQIGYAQYLARNDTRGIKLSPCVQTLLLYRSSKRRFNAGGQRTYLCKSTRLKRNISAPIGLMVTRPGTHREPAAHQKKVISEARSAFAGTGRIIRDDAGASAHLRVCILSANHPEASHRHTKHPGIRGAGIMQGGDTKKDVTDCRGNTL